MESLNIRPISVSSSLQFNQQFSKLAAMCWALCLAQWGKKDGDPCSKGSWHCQLSQSRLWKNFSDVDGRGDLARPSALSMNPAKSSDMKKHLWPPRVMGQPEGSTVVRGGEGYGEEWWTAALLPRCRHHCVETIKGALQCDKCRFLKSVKRS